MKAYLGDMLDSVLAMSPANIIGGILFALILSLPIVGAYAAFRKSSRDVTMVMVVVAMLTNVIAMTVGMGYVRHSFGMARENLATQAGRPPGSPNPGFRPPPGVPFFLQDNLSREMTRSLLANDDTDHDGSLSADEAAAIVKRAAQDGKDSLDFDTLRRAIQARLRLLNDLRTRAAYDAEEAALKKAQQK